MLFVLKRCHTILWAFALEFDKIRHHYHLSLWPNEDSYE